jgi:hypothetical protein
MTIPVIMYVIMSSTCSCIVLTNALTIGPQLPGQCDSPGGSIIVSMLPFAVILDVKWGMINCAGRSTTFSQTSPHPHGSTPTREEGHSIAGHCPTLPTLQYVQHTKTF